MTQPKVKAKNKRSKERGKDKKKRKTHPKGDDLVKMFHVEQKAKATPKKGVKPEPAPISSSSESVKHNTSEGIDKPTVEITISRFHVDYEPGFCLELIEHMEKGYSYESFAAALSPITIEKDGHTTVLKRRTYGEQLYRWEKAHPDFCEAKKIGFEACRLFWEGMGALGMAGKIKGFNNITWLFNMKNRFRREWKDRHEVNMKGSDNSGGLTQPKAVFLIPMNGREKPPEKDVTPKKEGDDDAGN